MARKATVMVLASALAVLLLAAASTAPVAGDVTPRPPVVPREYDQIQGSSAAASTVPVAGYVMPRPPTLPPYDQHIQGSAAAAAAAHGGCEGANEEDECMMRRPLAAAHTDYIYTQQHHN